MLTMLVFAMVLGVLITVHELGHFLAAKWCKVRVEAFSIGFGKKIFSVKRGETEYCLSLIPLGGYVKLAGENPEEQREGTPWEFASKSVAQRAAIVGAGPVFNYLLGFFLLSTVFFVGMPTLTPKIGGFLATAPRAAVAALLPGQESAWGQFFENPQAPILVFKQDALASIDAAALAAEAKAQLLALAVTAAERAGLEKGDRVRTVAGVAVRTWDDFTAAIKKRNTGEPVAIQVERDSRVLDFSLQPRVETEKNIFGDTVTVGRIGVVAADDFETVRYGMIESLQRAGRQLFQLTTQTYWSLFKMISGKLSAREQLLGPVGIYKFTGVIARHGVMALLHWMALLSVSLAIINLFPLPVLDGGHILFLLAEQVRGRPLSLKSQEFAMKAGIAVLIVVGIFVFYNDLLRIKFFETIAQFWQRR